MWRYSVESYFTPTNSTCGEWGTLRTMSRYMKWSEAKHRGEM